MTNQRDKSQNQDQTQTRNSPQNDNEKNVVSMERRKEMAARSPSSEKLSEALKLLDEAAMERKDEIQGLLNEKYQNLRSTLSQARPFARQAWSDVSHSAQEMSRMAKERSTEIAQQLDEEVHNRPWAYIGGTAVAGLVLGFLLGRKS